LIAVVLLAAATPLFLFWRRMRPPPDSAAPSVVTSSAMPIEAPTAPGAAPASGSPSSSTPPPSASVPKPADPPLPPHAHLDPRTTASCPEGMVLVDGVHCPAVAHFCDEWVGADPTSRKRTERRCRRHRNLLICEGRPAALHFCIDRYEYPNQLGVLPAVMTSYRAAAEACAIEGKRLCESDEWVFACEGAGAWPYPHGLERNPSACNVDRPERPTNPRALEAPANVSLEIERLDQRVASGALPGCASPFGVLDMSGNVAEWVHHRHGRRGEIPSDTALAGGDWERTPATCRALDARHDAEHVGHALGFRCCRDALDKQPPRRLLPEGVRLPKRRAVVP
jgi:hypothetical protein